MMEDERESDDDDSMTNSQNEDYNTYDIFNFNRLMDNAEDEVLDDLDLNMIGNE